MTVPSVITVSAGNFGLITDSVDLNYPSGVRFQDILLALVFADAGVTNTIDSYEGSPELTLLHATATGVRRGVAVFFAYATGNESGTNTVFVRTSGAIGSMGGCIALIRNGNVSGGIHSFGSAGITSSTAPAPASITTAVDESLAMACIAYDNTGTITPIASNNWIEANEAVLDGGGRSMSFQMAPVGAAGTISGGSATLGTSGNWGVITFGIKPAIPFFRPPPLVVG